ncbi:MAG TPA: tol-pal system protein YbgF [Burkholderiales bacterium]|nr:tol-pal system protein YbgF [Burkholderiales bacterium]
MRRIALAAVFSALALPAAAQGLFDDNEARRRVEILRGQLNEHTRTVDERLSKIEAAVSGAGDRSAILALASQIDELRGEIARLRGQAEVVAHQVELAERRQKDLYLDIDTRLRRLEQAQELAATSAAALPPPAAAESQQTSEVESKAYQAALDQFKLGNYGQAVTAMQGFLITYPKSPLAPNAQYWVGMAHSGQRDYKSAIAAQRKLLATWPQSQKAPDALLSIASAQETMGERQAALKTLEEVIAKYPDSSAASSAKQRLAALSKR